jgi:chromosome segregation ATPase
VTSVFQDEYARVAKDLDGARAETKAVQREHDTLKLETADLKQRLAEALSEADQLRTQLAGAVGKLRATDTFINAASSLKASEEAARAESAQATDRIASLEEKVAKVEAARVSAEERGNALAAELETGAAAVARADKLVSAFRLRLVADADIKAAIND